MELIAVTFTMILERMEKPQTSIYQEKVKAFVRNWG